MKWVISRGNILVRPSKSEDIDFLKTRLRKSDVEEMWASTHLLPEEVLPMSKSISTCCQTVLLREIPVAIFGASPTSYQEDTAAVWMMATDDIRLMCTSFLRMSKACISKMLDEYPLLFNWVDVRNATSIEWLRWCGARLDAPRPFGPDMMPFHFFTIKRSDLCARQ